MVWDEVYQRFATSSPAVAMMRGILENCLSAQRLETFLSRPATATRPRVSSRRA